LFEDRTYEKILAEALAAAPSGVDIRQGSIYFDAVAGICIQLARYYVDLRSAMDLTSLDTMIGEYLDSKGEEYGVYRIKATYAYYSYIYVGTQPNVGDRFFTDSRYFRLQSSGTGLCLEAEIAGTINNNILEGTPATPTRNITGLTSSAFGELIEPGIDIESDEDYRQRIREKISGQAENGNRQHYKTWCEDVAGVGRARIIPLFAGENTVLAVLLGKDGAPAVDAVVARVQEYIDPATKGLVVEYGGKTLISGDGVGDGKANIGAHFTAMCAETLPLTVSFSAELATGYTAEDAILEAQEVITAYLKDIALNSGGEDTVIVRISTVGASLYSLPSIIDYDDLAFNGKSANIEVAATAVAVLEEVKVNEII